MNYLFLIILGTSTNNNNRIHRFDLIPYFNNTKLDKLSEAELHYQERLLKYQRDYKNTIDFAFDEGKKVGIKEGIEEAIKEWKLEGKIEVAKSLKQNGVSIDIIAANTGLTKEEIEGL